MERIINSGWNWNAVSSIFCMAHAGLHFCLLVALVLESDLRILSLNNSKQRQNDQLMFATNYQSIKWSKEPANVD